MVLTRKSSREFTSKLGVGLGVFDKEFIPFLLQVNALLLQSTINFFNLPNNYLLDSTRGKESNSKLTNLFWDKELLGTVDAKFFFSASQILLGKRGAMHLTRSGLL